MTLNTKTFPQDPGSGTDGAPAVAVGVAAHYKRNVATQEELLLHIIKVS